MKIKNVNFIEKHVEKIVLGVGLACALGVLFMYALSDPYYVKSGNGDPLYPADVELKLQNQTKELERNLNSPNSGLPPITIPPYTATFEYLAHQTPPSPRPNLIYWWASPGLDPMVFWIEGDEPRNRPTYVIPPVPLPTDVVARANFAKLGRTTDAQRAQLDALTHATGPGDFFYVTVSGNFDMGKWRDAIMAGKDEKTRIKEEWFRNAYLVTFVYVVRSDWDDEKQEWGPQVRIEALPGNPDFANPQGPFNEADGQTLLREIRLNRKPIAEPPFLPVDPKRPWTLTTDIDPSIRIRQLSSDLTDTQKRLETLTKDSNTGKDRRLNAKEQQEARELNAKMTAIREELAKLQAAQAQAGANRPDDGGINMVQKVWAHDVTVQPGKRYRYRLMVGIQNPLFQRNAALQPQQKMQQNNRVSQVTEYPSNSNEGWVEVTVPKNNHFFVIGAQKAANPQESTVEAEVWKVFNAGWHKQVFTVQPGDAIGQTVETTVDDKPYSLDLKTGRTLVDIYFTGQAATGQQVGQAIMVDAKEQLLQIPTDSQVQDPIRQQLLMDSTDPGTRAHDPAPEAGPTKSPANVTTPAQPRVPGGPGGTPAPRPGAGPSGPGAPPSGGGPGVPPGARPLQPGAGSGPGPVQPK